LTEIQSLARGLQVLDILESSSEGIGITQIAERLNIDKSSASRILKTLANYGYADQSDSTRRYRLGPRVVQLGQNLLKKTPLRDEARPFLGRLVQRTNECAHLAVLSNAHAFYLDLVESSASLRVSAGIGTMAPLHCTALGKVLLAFNDEPVPRELDKYTPRTITDAETLRVHLEQARRQGYAVDDEEYEYGVRCVAAPIYDVNKDLVGAMGISGPVGRLALERIPQVAEIVMDVVQALTDQLSFK
jgi:IclR family KDG regulon transcriptional repressor